MQFLDNLIGPTVTNLSKAMDRATERHSALTANLANVNTPGYKRRDVDFGIVLEGEMKRPSHLEQWRQASAQRTSSGSIQANGNSVNLEQEVMALAETELRYQMLTDMTASYFRNLKNVIKEGR